ncbi:hypothetical protein TBR22_A06370 [Luteitalea sp. TBR-22]|uniref:peptidase inhibitor family I36 protein n=1 Tax=Luteitalea sp. TBR-22 TaxID=2802971 RepID=UPI001AFB07BC|nr:peptidase inhibitor family I36 protein [Luteitalea sp. TBR-22]BCS31436.1 hypothetical protein TBR22_A06370 [Luteitalea sp. TBR-22]
MRLLSTSLVAGLMMYGAASTASAQSWGRGAYPEAGACFYEDINFGGRYFCTRMGAAAERVPSQLNDEISSVRVFGGAEVLVFRDGSMRGEARRFTNSVRDLRNSGFNDRLTSFVVQPRGYADRGYSNGGYGYGNQGYGNQGYGNPGYGYGGYDNNGRYGNGQYGNGRYGNGRYDDPAYGYGRDQGRYQGGVNRGSYQEAARMVQQAYRRVFGREPDRDAQPWVDEVLKNGWSQRQLEQALRNTPEGRGY